MSDFLTLEVRYGPCAAIRIRELEADLARVTRERDKLQGFIANAFLAHPNLDMDIDAALKEPRT